MKSLLVVLALVLVGTAAAGGASRSAVSFCGPHTYRAGRHPTSVAVADLNADRKLDLAVASERNTVTVLLNHGSGRFPGQARLPSGWRSDLGRDRRRQRRS
jgi:hypothetical protein